MVHSLITQIHNQFKMMERPRTRSCRQHPGDSISPIEPEAVGEVFICMRGSYSHEHKKRVNDTHDESRQRDNTLRRHLRREKVAVGG